MKFNAFILLACGLILALLASCLGTQPDLEDPASLSETVEAVAGEAQAVVSEASQGVTGSPYADLALAVLSSGLATNWWRDRRRKRRGESV